MRAAKQALILAVIVAAMLAGLGLMLGSIAEAAPVVRAIQTVTVQTCSGNSCTQIRKSSPGSGVCVGRDKSGRLLVLTCAHGWTPSGPTVAVIDGDTPEKAAIVGFDGARDLCLLAVDHPAPVQVYPISSTVPAVGTQVTTQGYPHASKFRIVPTRIVGYAGNSLITAATFRQGESGGAVVCGNELVGIIQATSHADGASAHVRSIQDFLLASLGYQPIIAAPPAEKPVAVPAPKLLPEAHPAPLPAPATPVAATVIATGPDPLPAPPTHDEIRAIVSGELLKLPIPAGVNAAKLKAAIVSDLQAEFSTQLAAHGIEVKQAVADSVAAAKLDPTAFAPVLREAAQGAAQDVSRNVVAGIAPPLLSAVASHLGMGALAGSIGGPIGAGLGAGLGLIGFFLRRQRGQTSGSPGAIAVPAPRVAVWNLAPQAAPEAAAQASAPLPAPQVNTVVVQPGQVDTGILAFNATKQMIVQKHPDMVTSGVLQKLDAMFNQALSGLSPKVP